MYCSNCGAKKKKNEQFCANCGQSFEENTDSKETEDSKPPKKKDYGLFSMFSISDEDMAFQVGNHDSLSISKSSRGVAVLTILVLLVIGVLVVVGLNLFTSGAPISYFDVLVSLVIYLPLLYFVYKGHLWAIVLLAIFYTIDKIGIMFLLPPYHFDMGTFIFWVIGIGPMWVAFKVEREFRKKKMLTAVS